MLTGLINGTHWIGVFTPRRRQERMLKIGPICYCECIPAGLSPSNLPELSEITAGDEVGNKSVTLLVLEFLQDYKNEIGIHRLVRQSHLSQRKTTNVACCSRCDSTI